MSLLLFPWCSKDHYAAVRWIISCSCYSVALPGYSTLGLQHTAVPVLRDRFNTSCNTCTFSKSSPTSWWSFPRATVCLFHAVTLSCPPILFTHHSDSHPSHLSCPHHTPPPPPKHLTYHPAYLLSSLLLLRSISAPSPLLSPTTSLL